MDVTKRVEIGYNINEEVAKELVQSLGIQRWSQENKDYLNALLGWEYSPKPVVAYQYNSDLERAEESAEAIRKLEKTQRKAAKRQKIQEQDTEGVCGKLLGVFSLVFSLWFFYYLAVGQHLSPNCPVPKTSSEVALQVVS